MIYFSGRVNGWQKQMPDAEMRRTLQQQVNDALWGPASPTVLDCGTNTCWTVSRLCLPAGSA